MEQYNYWFEELDNPGCNSRDTNRVDLCGFWRIKGTKTKWDTPLAIWVDEGTGALIAQVSHQDVMEHDSSKWNGFFASWWMSAVACPEGDYRCAIATHMWPDSKPANEAAVPKKEPEPVKEPETVPDPVRVENRPEPEQRDVGMGHNQPPEEMGKDYAERLKAEVTLLNELSKDGATIDEEIAEQIGECKVRIGKIKSEATAEHKKKKAPWLAGGRKVDNGYNPTIKACDPAAARAGKLLNAFLQIEQTRLREEAEKQQIKDQQEADRKAKEKAELEGKNEEEVAEAKGHEVKLKEKKATVGKSAGRSVHLTTITTAEITDYDKLVEALKGRPEMKDLVQRLANAAAVQGKELAGMKIKEEKKAV
ncbi:MAG: hypothetical protein GY938_24420 [Ketobacter sp.]|nr:hypothetical protein [Ketobacter sp.]